MSISAFGVDHGISKALRPDDTKGSVMARNMPGILGGAAGGGAAGYLGALALRKPQLATASGAVGAGVGAFPGGFKHAKEQRQLRRQRKFG